MPGFSFCCASSAALRLASASACWRASSSAFFLAASCFFFSIAARRAFSSAVSFDRSSRASPSFCWTSLFVLLSVACEVVSVSRLLAASVRFFVVAACSVW